MKDRSRPGESGSESQAAAKQLDNGILLPLTDSLDDIAAHFDGAFVVVVETTGGRYRRRCFLSAASAERSAANALAKGYNAKVYLAELKPLWRLEGGTVAS